MTASPPPIVPRFLCARCPYETTSFTSYRDHLVTHYPHVTPYTPDPVPAWVPVLSREIL